MINNVIKQIISFIIIFPFPPREVGFLEKTKKPSIINRVKNQDFTENSLNIFINIILIINTFLLFAICGIVITN